MTEQLEVETALSRLKIFPLADAVLLPGIGLPLHIYEPRYRALVHDALEGDHVLAIAMLDAGRGADSERPPVRPIVGIGVIERHTRLTDGRYHILVRGERRVRIVSEHTPGHAYREVVAEAVREPRTGDAADIDRLRQGLLEIAPHLPKELAGPLTKAAAALDSPGRLCDVAAAALLDDPQALQEVLEALDVGQRIDRVLEGMSELRFKLAAPSPFLA